MDADAIMAKQLRQMEKEKKEKEFKLKTQEKKVHVLASCHGHITCSPTLYMTQRLGLLTLIGS